MKENSGYYYMNRSEKIDVEYKFCYMKHVLLLLYEMDSI